MTKVWIKEAYQFYNMIPRTFAPVKYKVKDKSKFLSIPKNKTLYLNSLKR